MPELIRAEGAGFITGSLMAAVGAICLLTISI